MAELRWTLLGIGALFVLGLLLWERYKRSRNRSSSGDSDSPPLERTASFTPIVPDDHDDAVPRRVTREPRREVAQHLPVVDIDDAEADAAAAQAAQRLQTEQQIDEMGNLLSVPLDAPETLRGMRVESMVSMEDPAGRAEQWIAAAGVRSLRAEDLRVDWPPDDQRSILALRVEARGKERLGGRAVRQSLLGEGFIFGTFDIFHLPLADGRVVVSAASLTKPGSFSLATIDAQTFLGLNLFCVLPGPLAGAESLERLVASGRLLAQRLRADLLDTQGQPLTESRLAEMRSKVVGMRATSAEAPSGAAVGDPV